MDALRPRPFAWLGLCDRLAIVATILMPLVSAAAQDPFPDEASGVRIRDPNPAVRVIRPGRPTSAVSATDASSRFPSGHAVFRTTEESESPAGPEERTTTPASGLLQRVLGELSPSSLREKWASARETMHGRETNAGVSFDAAPDREIFPHLATAPPLGAGQPGPFVPHEAALAVLSDDARFADAQSQPSEFSAAGPQKPTQALAAGDQSLGDVHIGFDPAAQIPSLPHTISDMARPAASAAEPSDQEAPRETVPAVSGAEAQEGAFEPVSIGSPPPRRRVLDSDSVHSLKRVIRAQQRLETESRPASEPPRRVQVLAPVARPADTPAASLADTPAAAIQGVEVTSISDSPATAAVSAAHAVVNSPSGASLPAASAPAAFAVVSESAAPIRKVTAEGYHEAPPRSPMQVADAAAVGPPPTRFVRVQGDRLERITAKPPATAIGGSALPPMPRYVTVDELVEFLGPRSQPHQAAGHHVDHGIRWLTSAAGSNEAPPADDGLKTIAQVQTDIRPTDGELPEDAAAARFALAGSLRHGPGTNRDWMLYEYWWQAPALCHSPLYYEEINLERYGYSHGALQPAFSAAHFFGATLSLPYLMTAEPPRQCQYTLGHYRPGSYAPAHLYRPPFSIKAATVQAAAVTGLIFLLP